MSCNDMRTLCGRTGLKNRLDARQEPIMGINPGRNAPLNLTNDTCYLLSYEYSILSLPVLCSFVSLISPSNLEGAIHSAHPSRHPHHLVRRFGKGAVGVRDGVSDGDAPTGYTSQEQRQRVRRPPRW